MPGPAGYTSLEALLLFQSLRTYGISLEAFTKAAQQLKDDPQIRQDASYDASRLNAPQLREFFLRVWKDEAQHQDGVNVTLSTSPRKRKAGSPPLPTIQDAARDSVLLPKLIIRLYGRYRQQVVADIRADEAQYNRVLRDLKDIRRGYWDTRLQAQLDETKNARLAGSNGVVKDSTAAATRSNDLLQPVRDRRDGTQRRSPSPNSTTIELPTTIPRPAIQPRTTPGIGHSAASSPSKVASVATDRPSTIQSFQTQGPTVNYETTGHHGPRSMLSPGPTALSSHTRTKSPVTSSSPSLLSDSQPVQAQTTGINSASSKSPDGLAGSQAASASAAQSLQRGGVMLPPFQVAPQVPTSLQPQTLPKTTSTPLPPALIPRAQQSTPSHMHQSAVTTPITAKTQQAPSPLVLSISKMLSNPSLTTTPVSSPGAAKRLVDTKWKDSPAAGVPKSPTRPRSRSVSPISETEASPQSNSKPVVRPSRASAGQRQCTPAMTLPRPSRSTRKTRGASVASSALDSSVRGRTRSMSILSHASADLGAKAEPSTPNGPMDIDVPALPSTRRVTRGKRKRSPTATSEIGEVPQTEIERPMPRERTSVFATRNFQRLSNAVMNDIMSHKHASIFSHPVRDRDADGYSSIIRRPTDLKTIKASIGAGARAVNAANTDSEQLPWSEDLVPPKGIVNTAQLEKEVVRVFANAVMFNPGEDDVVRDAREMFESAAESLMNFKNAEQRTESSGVSGLRKRAESEASQAAQEEDTSVAASVGKRRKLA